MRQVQPKMRLLSLSITHLDVSRARNSGNPDIIYTSEANEDELTNT